MLRRVRTTICLDERLLREAKGYAAHTGVTLSAVIEEALRASFEQARSMPAEHPSLPVFRPRGSRGFKPGVDLSGSSKLLDVMEGRRR